MKSMLISRVHLYYVLLLIYIGTERYNSTSMSSEKVQRAHDQNTMSFKMLQNEDKGKKESKKMSQLS